MTSIGGVSVAMIKKTRTVQTVEQTLTMTGEGIIHLLKKLELIPTDKAQIKVTFTVPGGGDWSGETIEIDKDNPVTVTITRTTEVKQEE